MSAADVIFALRVKIQNDRKYGGLSSYVLNKVGRYCSGTKETRDH